MGVVDCFSVLKCSFALQHSSRRESIYDEDAVAFLKINDNTVPHAVFSWLNQKWIVEGDDI